MLQVLVGYLRQCQPGDIELRLFDQLEQQVHGTAEQRGGDGIFGLRESAHHHREDYT